MGRTTETVRAVVLLSLLGCSSTTTTRFEAEAGGESGRAPDVGGSIGGEGGDAGSSDGGAAEGVGGAPSAGSGGAGGAGGGAAGLCARFCGQVQTACTGDVAVYTSDATCLGVCGALPTGAEGDEVGNSVHCRLRQAHHAADTAEPALHCPMAGPGGDGTCGQNCEAYCLLLRTHCSARFDGTFDGLAACTAACQQIPDAGGYTTAMSQGDSIQCRLWHVSAAAVDPSMHCGHAAGDLPCAAPSP